MISTEKLVNATRGHEALRGFQPQDVQRLATLGTEMRFEPDQLIFHQGEKSRNFYLIVSGRVALESVSGEQIIPVMTLNEGEEMGWSALFSNGLTHFQARAVSLVHAVAFDGKQLREECEQDAAFGYVVMKRLLEVVTERLDATRMQLLDIYETPGVAAI
jgi:CRP/FNR family transcriptional regulator, cyclic AMP receptor protein